jgi:hypothetical protein
VTDSHYVALGDLELSTLLSEPQKCWNYRCVSCVPFWSFVIKEYTGAGRGFCKWCILNILIMITHIFNMYAKTCHVVHFLYVQGVILQ